LNLSLGLLHFPNLLLDDDDDDDDYERPNVGQLEVAAALAVASYHS
jgi:hypothetical protein